MKTPKTFQKIFIAILLVVCSLNVQIFANEVEINPPTNTATNSIEWNNLKQHRLDFSYETMLFWYSNSDAGGRYQVYPTYNTYFSYSYGLTRSFCSFYTRFRLGLGTDFRTSVYLAPIDVAFGLRLNDLKHSMQYDIYLCNISLGPYYPASTYMPLIAFVKSGVDIRYKNFLFGAYLLTTPNIGFGLNLGYSFEL